MPIATIVEVAFTTAPLDPDPEWTDITRWVRIVDQIKIQRGAVDELQEIPAGMLSLILDNSDGRFSPGNSAGPYYPNVRKHRRIRVRQVHVHSNWVPNGGFESAATTDWSTFGAAVPTLAASTTHAHTGTYGMRITWATGTTGNGAQSTLTGLQVGATYTAHAWVWVTGGVPAVRLGISGAGAGAASTTTGAWEQISHTFTATATSHLLQVTPDASTTSGQQVWIDDVMVGLGDTLTAFDATAPLISHRFTGFVNRWPVTWPGGGRVAHTPITATDWFKPVAKHAVRSLLEEEILADNPLAYYPLSEPAGSTSAGDLSGTPGGALAIAQTGAGGELAFAANTGPAADGLSAPQFTPIDATNGVYLAGDLGSDFEDRSTAFFISVEGWFSTSVTGRTMWSLRSNPFVYGINFLLESGTGRMQLVMTYRTFSGHITTDVNTWVTANLADGQVHHVLYDESDGELFVDGVSYGTQVTPPVFKQRLLSVASDFGTACWDGGVAHVAVRTSASPVARVAAHYNAGANGLSGETADDRITRIAGYAGIDVDLQGTLFDPVASQGSGGKSALSLLQEVAASESGRLFASRETGLVYQARDLRYGRASSLTLSAADLGPPTYADDDQFLVNRVEASRPNGATIRIENTASQADYFLYPKPLTLLKTSDAALVDAAQWLINRYADPPPRIQSVEAEGATLGTTTYRALLGLEISDVITVTDLPSQAPASTEVLTIEGWQEVIDVEHHTWTFTTSPAAVDQVWQLDSSAYSQLDETTRLAY